MLNAPSKSDLCLSEQALRIRFSGRRILIVDDDRVTCEIVADLLQEFGLVVEAASNGAEAFNLAQIKHYDLIFMDLHMPVMDGFESTRLIRQLPNGSLVPILALTASAFKDDEVLCSKAGMNDFVSKPVTLGALSEYVLKWLVVDL